MPTFEDALALAAQAHKGQYDLAGAPYICHPMRVALAQSDERARIVGQGGQRRGVLHALQILRRAREQASSVGTE